MDVLQRLVISPLASWDRNPGGFPIDEAFATVFRHLTDYSRQIANVFTLTFGVIG